MQLWTLYRNNYCRLINPIKLLRGGQFKTIQSYLINVYYTLIGIYWLGGNVLLIPQCSCHLSSYILHQDSWTSPYCHLSHLRMRTDTAVGTYSHYMYSLVIFVSCLIQERAVDEARRPGSALIHGSLSSPVGGVITLVYVCSILQGERGICKLDMSTSSCCTGHWCYY